MDTSLFVLAGAYVFYTPFTKVEESFNLQAMHDILYLRSNFSAYDHLEFPGVVPRTFIGPLFVSLLSTPFVLLINAFAIDKFWAQYVVRLMLTATVAVAWTKLRKVIGRLYGSGVRAWFVVITLSQFHFMFYMSRPLPNIMALPLVLFALSYWLRDQLKPFIVYSGIAVIIFRSELAVFLGLLLLNKFVQRKISMFRLVKIASPAALVILSSTVLVDSFFWQRLLWPEGEVLWYNTILNKSSNWGTSPFFWYFYSALPKGLGASFPLALLGFAIDRRMRPIMFAALAFVFLYSFLPHKELRFIIYTFPVMNLAAACACHRIWIHRNTSRLRSAVAWCVGAHLLVNTSITVFLLMVSRTNYPGGNALLSLHKLEAQTTNVSVHMDNLAAQTGVSRFLQMRDDWSYSKQEALNYTADELAPYTHLLVEAKGRHNTHIWLTLQQEFELLNSVECFSNIGMQHNGLLLARIKTKDCIGILRRRSVIKGANHVGLLELAVHPDETKDINFEDLHNLALGKPTSKTKSKLKELVEQIDTEKQQQLEKRKKTKLSPKQAVRTIIKEERVKRLIDTIANTNLKEHCDFERVTVKDCLKKVIDEIDIN